MAAGSRSATAGSCSAGFLLQNNSTARPASQESGAVSHSGAAVISNIWIPSCEVISRSKRVQAEGRENSPSLALAVGCLRTLTLPVWSLERPAGGIGRVSDFSLEELMLRVVASASADPFVTPVSRHEASGI